MNKKHREENLNDLNTYLIPRANGDTEEELAFKFSEPNNTNSKNGEIECCFRDLEKHLINKIKQYPVVVGCIAWLTNKRILKALATKEAVSIIIQKEDFLRPDSDNWSGIKLRKLYSQLPHGVIKYDENNTQWGEIINRLSTSYSWETRAVRWMGNFNTEKNPAFPRMHNKFLVFCDIKKVKKIERFPGKSYEYESHHIMPKALWTGSFNLTHNATCSLENAVFIKNKEIVGAYYKEWQYIFALSETIEEIDWAGNWDVPGFRIGT